MDKTLLARIETKHKGYSNLDFEIVVGDEVIRTFDINEGRSARDFVDGYNTAIRKHNG